jgi:ferritin-like protein
MRNALQIYATLKELSDYLADDAEQFTDIEYSWQDEDRRKEIKAIREELNQLATDARTKIVTHFQFQMILDRLDMLGATPPGDIVSKVMYNLYDN